MASFLFGIIFLCSVSIADAATYYLDAVSGNDLTGIANDINHSFKTIDKINSFFQAGTIVHGDYIKFKKGTTPAEETFRGQINLHSCSGSPGSPITLTTYGSGSYKPLLNSASILTDHSAAGWTGPNGNGVYTYNPGGGSAFIYEDGYALRAASSSACSDGNVFFVGNIIYYKPTSGGPANHLIERGWHDRTIYDSGNNYISIDGLKFIREGLYHNYAHASGSGITGWTIQNCDFINRGVRFWQGGGYTWIDLTIKNCTFDYCFGCSIVCEGGASSSESFLRLHILNNIISHNNTLEQDGLEWGPGVEGWDNDCIAIQTMTNSTISGNDISGYCTRNAGITYWISPLPGVVSTGNEISNNYIHDLLGTDSENLMGAIRYDAGSGTSNHNIKIINNIIARFVGKGILLVNGQDPANPSLVANNTIYSGDEGIHLETGKNYIVKNNIVHTMTRYYFMYYIPDPTNVINYNCYYDVSSGNKFKYQGSEKTFIGWKITSGYDANSLAINPPFTNQNGLFNKVTDFNLRARLPGVSVGLTQDYLHKPLNNPPDMGAFSY